MQWFIKFLFQLRSFPVPLFLLLLAQIEYEIQHIVKLSNYQVFLLPLSEYDTWILTWGQWIQFQLLPMLDQHNYEILKRDKEIRKCNHL